MGLIGGGAAAAAMPETLPPTHYPSIGSPVGFNDIALSGQSMTPVEYMRGLIERKNSIGAKKEEGPPLDYPHVANVNCLKSVSASHKLHMIATVEHIYRSRREAWDIQREIDGLIAKYPMLKAVL